MKGYIFQGLLIPGRVEEVRRHQNVAGDALEVRSEPLGQEQGDLEIRPHFGDARIGPHRAQLFPNGAVCLPGCQGNIGPLTGPPRQADPGHLGQHRVLLAHDEPQGHVAQASSLWVPDGLDHLVQILGPLHQQSGHPGLAVNPQLLYQSAEFQLHEQLPQGFPVLGAGMQCFQVHRQGHLGLELGQLPAEPRLFSMFL